MGSDGKRFFIAGKAGSGKSVFARHAVADRPRLIIFDPKDEPDWKKGAEVLQHFAQFPKFLRDMGDGAFRVYYSPEGMQAEKRLATLSRMLMDWQKPHGSNLIERPITLVVEEMSDAFPISLRAGLTGFAELVRKGRARGISVVGIAQRPAEVNANFRGNLDACVSFRFSFVNDRIAIAKAMQDEAVTDELMRLEPYHSIRWDGDAWSKCPPV